MPRMPRAQADELLDAPDQDLVELADSLAQVAQANRLFGGVRALRRHLSPFASRRDVRVLDVGTGNGRVAADLANWAAARGGHWTVTGVDLHPDVIRVARSAPRGDGSTLALVRADASLLPFRDAAFDVACATLTLHHFGPRDAVGIVAEMGRVARDLVLVNDLERRRLHYLCARVLSWTLWRGNRLTRHDGPLSVLRSFTMDELLEIGERAGLVRTSVRRHFPFRLVLEGRPDSVEATP